MEKENKKNKDLRYLYYSEEIIEMVKKIENSDILEYLYAFIGLLLEKRG